MHFKKARWGEGVYNLMKWPQCNAGINTHINAHRYRVKGIVVIKNDTYTQKQCASQEKCLFSEAVSFTSFRSPSKILASPEPSESVPRHRGEFES